MIRGNHDDIRDLHEVLFMEYNIKDLKIILRFVFWGAYINNISTKDILINYIKNSDELKELCKRSITYNMYITGYIRFCNSIHLKQNNFKEILNKEEELKKLDLDLDKTIKDIENNILLKNYNDIFLFLIK